MNSTVIQQLKSALNTVDTTQPLWVAYSGGIDSHALLHALVQLQPLYGFTLHAIHVNHGLNSKAEEWAMHCQQVCKNLAVQLHLLKINIQSTPQKSLEELARNARYESFKELIKEGDYLATAHHADDQAETFLLQLIRGAGTKGLSAMPILSTLGKGFLFRPLLPLGQSELKNYALSQQLQWIEDESNEVVTFDRNYIRHYVLPPLKSRWPHIINSIYYSAKHCAESEALLNEQVLNDLQQTEEEGKLNLLKLTNLSRVRRHHVLRYWLKQQGFPTPSRAHLDQFEKQFVGTRQDANPKLCWSTIQLRCYQNHLYVLPTPYPETFSDCLTWDLAQPLELPATLGLLTTKKKQGKGISSTLLKNHPLIEVRFRHGGEKFYTAHHQKLKKRFQDWKIPPWERGRIPLIYINGELAQIVTGPQSYTTPKFVAKENEMGIWATSSQNLAPGCFEECRDQEGKERQAQEVRFRKTPRR